jgi:hypothetical protein
MSGAPCGDYFVENGFGLLLKAFLQFVDLLHDGPEFFQFTLVLGTDDFTEDHLQHWKGARRGVKN